MGCVLEQLNVSVLVSVVRDHRGWVRVPLSCGVGSAKGDYLGKWPRGRPLSWWVAWACLLS